MIGWLSLTDDQRRISLAQAETNSGIIAKALEKDWWVTLTLKALFQTPFSDGLVFKGGTSLSKCWKLINRFSEDIDISLSPALFDMEYLDEPRSGYLSRLKRRGCEFTSNDLVIALQEQFRIIGVPDGAIAIRTGEVLPTMRDKDPQELYIAYRSLYEPNPYLPDEVKIEVGVRAKMEPYTAMPVTSLLHEHFPNPAYDETPFVVQAIEPKKTFLEKAFLLHEMFNREGTPVIRTERMSRHFHDLVVMMRTEVKEQALADKELYATIIKHRRYYNKLRGLDYDGLAPHSINFYPPERLVEAFRADYRAMLENMIYGEAPTEAELFEQVAELLQHFKQSV